MDRSHSSHASLRAAQKTALWQATARKTLPWQPKSMLLRHSKNIPQTFVRNPDTWERTTKDWAKWCSSIHKGAMTCRANRTAIAEQWRQARKAIPVVPQFPVCTARETSKHGLALPAICTLTDGSSQTSSSVS